MAANDRTLAAAGMILAYAALIGFTDNHVRTIAAEAGLWQFHLTRSVMATGPVSRPASMRITMTPVSASPAMIARWMGAAPRQRGSSEAWPFQQPSGTASRMACGRISP